MAQKPAVIDLEELRKLAVLNPTMEEIGAFFRLSKPTVIKYMKQKAYAQVLEEGRSTRKTSLKRYQWQLAAKLNPAMLIWLGKNELDQREPRTEFAGKLEVETTQAPPRAASVVDWHRIVSEVRSLQAEAEGGVGR